MKQWSSAMLPLGILLVLAALTFWLRYVTDFTEKPGDGKLRHDPDFIVNGATLRKIGESGSLEYTLIADEIRHYPDDDTTRMDRPKLVYLQPTKPPVTISAVHGVMGPKGERVDLSEQVEVRRAGSDKNPPLLVETAELTVFTSEEKASTKSHVLITQGNSWVQGVGMQVDNKLQTYLLESRVSGEIESPSAKKKKPQT